VATLSVEGLNKSAITRVEGIGWNTVDRWLEKASDCGRRFNDKETTGFKASAVTLRNICLVSLAIIWSRILTLRAVLGEQQKRKWG